MSLFICEKCGCVENTALGLFWSRKRDWFKMPEEDKGKALCSECAPIKYDDGTPTQFNNTWHGRFPKRQFSETNYVKLESGFVGHSDGSWGKVKA